MLAKKLPLQIVEGVHVKVLVHALAIYFLVFALKGLSLKAQGWAVLFAAQPWVKRWLESTLKGLCFSKTFLHNPFRVD